MPSKKSRHRSDPSDSEPMRRLEPAGLGLARASRLVFLLVCLLGGAGCVHLRQASHSRPVQPVPAAVLEAVAYTRPNRLECTVSNLESNAKFSLERITMQAAANHVATNRTLLLDYYRPVGTNRKAVIIVLPIIGGGYPLERYFCEYFARHGLASVLVRRDRLKTPDRLADINGVLQQAAVDARQTLDWSETRSELDPQRAGVFGISMGGIRAAFLTPLDPRIRASVIGLAGGDLPYIISHSRERGITRRRSTFLQKQQISLQEFEEGLKPIMVCDPLNVAPAIDPSKVLLVLATCDTAVPSSKGFELRRAMGKPETIIVTTGHYTALLFVPYIQASCLRFFHEKLGPDDK
jgi:hypothetical protein